MKEKFAPYLSPRGIVLGALALVTLGVAVLSVYVNYQILDPRFGGWAVPTVGALDTLWVVFQATEILAGNNGTRARRVRSAGLALTLVNAAIPTADLVMTGGGTFDLAVVLTPIAIVATKTAWWVTLPSLGRKVSAQTRLTIDAKRQEVADRLEEMEAEASHRIELLKAATGLEQRVAAAETDYRLSVLKIRQSTTETLHQQAEATEATVADKPLPESVTAIALPELETWTPVTPALPGRDGSGTDARSHHVAVTQVSDAAPDDPSQAHAVSVTPGVTEGVTPSRHTAQHVTLEQLAAVAGVPVPKPGEQLTDAQLEVKLRHLRYSDDPPLSYRQAVADFRGAGHVGSEERVRRVWGALMSKEETSVAVTEASDDEDEEEPEDADA